MQVKKLKPHIDRILPGSKWNFDLEDTDKILRVESEMNIVLAAIKLLQLHNYSCEELV